MNAIEVEVAPKVSDAGLVGGGKGGGSFAFGARDPRARMRSLLTDTVARTAVRVGALILTWYCLSTALGLFNKKVVGKKYGVFGKGAFPAPLLLTGIQFAFQTLLAKLVFATGLVERVGARMTWREWSRLVLPNGAVTGLDIGFSNASLVHITMSFYTMCKSTTPIFLLAFAFMWGLETPSWSLAGVVAVIVSGLLLLVQGEADFDATGFVLVMSASCMSGLRFTLTQVLLHGTRGKQDQDGATKAPQDSHGPAAFGGPLEVLEHLTPVMSVTTLLLSLVSERLWATLPASPYFSSLEHCLITLCIILVGALLAFFMVWAEYQVIKETSALTFMIAGTVKEVVTVITAVLVFGDKFGPVNGVGLLIVIAGVLLFNWFKLRRLKAEVRQRIHSRDGSFDLDLSDGDDDREAAAAAAGGGAGTGATLNGGSGSPGRRHHILIGAGAAAVGGGGVDGSRTASPDPAGGGAVGSFTRRKSGIGGGAGAPRPDHEDGGGGTGEQLGPEDLQALEFEPLLRR